MFARWRIPTAELDHSEPAVRQRALCVQESVSPRRAIECLHRCRGGLILFYLGAFLFLEKVPKLLRAKVDRFDLHELHCKLTALLFVCVCV